MTNKLVQDLAEHCDFYVGNEWYMETPEEKQRIWTEKFAELIVAECMEQVWYTREDGINGNISEVIKQRMKQHFGVEE